MSRKLSKKEYREVIEVLASKGADDDAMKLVMHYREKLDEAQTKIQRLAHKVIEAEGRKVVEKELPQLSRKKWGAIQGRCGKDLDAVIDHYSVLMRKMEGHYKKEMREADSDLDYWREQGNEMAESLRLIVGTAKDTLRDYDEEEE